MLSWVKEFRVGAHVQFDRKKWLPIPVSHVLEDCSAATWISGAGWGSSSGRNGEGVWQAEENTAAAAGRSGTRATRPSCSPRAAVAGAAHCVRGCDGGGALVAERLEGLSRSGRTGGVLLGRAVERELAAPLRKRRAARRTRPGDACRDARTSEAEDLPGIVAMCGPHRLAHSRDSGSFHVIDLGEWYGSRIRLALTRPRIPPSQRRSPCHPDPRAPKHSPGAGLLVRRARPTCPLDVRRRSTGSAILVPPVVRYRLRERPHAPLPRGRRRSGGEPLRLVCRRLQRRRACAGDRGARTALREHLMFNEAETLKARRSSIACWRRTGPRSNAAATVGRPGPTT